LIFYEIIFRPFKGKWIFMAVSAVVVWFSFELIFGKSAPEYVATELVLNQTGAEGRLDQVTFGMKEVRANPIFGIGKDPPALPFWRGNILDNFWLQMAVQFGIPALVIVLCAFALHFLRVSFRAGFGRAGRAVPQGLPDGAPGGLSYPGGREPLGHRAGVPDGLRGHGGLVLRQAAAGAGAGPGPPPAGEGSARRARPGRGGAAGARPGGAEERPPAAAGFVKPWKGRAS
jgi:hypothetical protein